MPAWEAAQWDWPLNNDDGIVKVTNSNTRFEVGLEVHHFSPREVEVKVMGDDLVIHCQQQPSDGSRRMGREIHRTYRLPQDIDHKTLESRLNRGILIISAEKIVKA